MSPTRTSPVFRTVRQISVGILRDAGMRRQAMGLSIVAAATLLFAGSTFLGGSLEKRPLLFLLWWAGCGWLTLLSTLLALYDLLVIRQAARARRRDLLRRISKDLPPDPPSGKPLGK